MSSKRIKAEDVALTIIATEDVEVTEEKIEHWSDDDLFEWLELWDYEWNSKEWVPA
jgi:hypothetical protein